MTKKGILKIFLLSLIIQSCSTTKKSIEATKSSPTITTTIPSEELTKTWGLDISHHQEVRDWDKLKEQELGFIFVKATEGSNFQDPKYLEYYNQIRKLKIPVGSYHFFTYLSTGKNQAKNFLTYAKCQRGDLPLVLDAEFSKKMPEKEQVTKELKEFVASVYIKTGIYPIIYCPYKYYNLYVKGNLLARCKLWIVDYAGRPNCDWTFWQTTEKYTVQGIKGYVDFNQFNGTKKDLKQLLLLASLPQ